MDKIKSLLEEYNNKIATLNLAESLQYVANTIEGKHVFSTSFGIEDQLIHHFLDQFENEVSIFTLDTGRQFNETYEVFQKTQDKYKQKTIHVYYPNELDIQDYVSKDGVNGFYDSIESRKSCCFVRKVKPLKKAIAGANLWITGLRAEQSQNRETMQFLEWDEDNQLIKFNPLLKFSLEEVEELVAQHNIPINSLYKKGYLSIGCAPCTRALEEGEDFRAGRWWWENGKKECGLHIHQDKNN
ncbi:phosphoadenylyl-sulfate reductase [Flavobacterium sp. N2270]|uniref:phosphoadenylyl-sulfate reductase n=1 Tax=Flavobacterium sp. N2270 TaxID=2986831 RepID=UPI0022257BE4|nr:phosphoadenylyl-sulfate reductase [Flavobacterium sp. N2270]